MKIWSEFLQLCEKKIDEKLDGVAAIMFDGLSSILMNPDPECKFDMLPSLISMLITKFCLHRIPGFCSLILEFPCHCSTTELTNRNAL